MRAEPIARYLVRFDAEEVEPPPSFMIVPEPIVDPAEVEARLREAGRVEGFEAGLAAARDEAARAQETAAHAFEMRLAEERTRWTSEEAAPLAAALGAQFAALAADIAHCIEQVLRPFLSSALRETALVDLAGCLARLGDEAPLIRIAGPADLLDALRRLEALPEGAVEFHTGAGVDVRVIAQPTVIETRVGAWAERLSLGREGTARV